MPEDPNTGLGPALDPEEDFEARVKAAKARAEKYGLYYDFLSPLEQEAYLEARSAPADHGMDSVIALLRNTIERLSRDDPQNRDLPRARKTLARFERTNRSFKRSVLEEARTRSIINVSSHLVSKNDSTSK